jgi:hypothetical protein
MSQVYDQLLMRVRNERDVETGQALMPRERGPDLTPSPTVPAGRGHHFLQSNWAFGGHPAA